jgi:hypothetical protein
MKLRKSILALAMAAGSFGLVPLFAGGGASAPCSCCEQCACDTCVCNEQGCACDTGGDCACSGSCCATACCAK